MYKYLVVILLSFLLYGCAASFNTAKNIPNKGTKGKVIITNALGNAAVSMDGVFIGTTPLNAPLPVGEHRITLNHLGKIIYDSTIVVTDDYDRNTTTALVGGIVGGFVPFLLLPFPLNLVSIIVPSITTFTAEREYADKIILNDFIPKIAMENESEQEKTPKQEYSSSVSLVDDSAEIMARNDAMIHEYNDISENLPSQNLSPETAMYEVDKDKILFLKFTRNTKSSIFVAATSVCYDLKSDLVWAYEPYLQKTNTYYSNDFLPCDLDSISYTSEIKAGLIGFGAVAAVGAIVGAIVGGGKGAFTGGFAMGAFVGLPTAYIVGGVVNKNNKRACQRFRDGEQVKEWYRRYSCRQNTNPIPESKNQ